jgi:predicted TPR repeat methyltransferase
VPWETETFEYSTLHRRLRTVRDVVVALRPRSVLELGCGVGVLRESLLAAIPDVDYWGCDISESAVAQIADCHVVARDLNADGLPFGARSFDVIVGSGIVEYVQDPVALFAAAQARLNANGHLVVSYLNMRRYARYALTRRGPRRMPDHPDWKNRFTFGQFEESLTASGFADVRITPIGLVLPYAFAVPVRRFPFRRTLAKQLVFAATSSAGPV